MEREAEAIIKSIHTLYKVELIKLPQSTRSMKWDDYVAQCQQDGSNPTVLSEAISQVVEDVRSEIDPQIMEAKTAMASTVKKRGGRQPKAAKENEAPVRQSARKATSASRVLADTSNLETPSAARSTRGKNKSLETPMTGIMPPDMGRTPMITPKFNMATPLCRTVTRTARANETLVSLSGSPVAPLAPKTKAAKAAAENFALLPIGKGQTLNLPVGPEIGGGLEAGELDEEAWAKLAAIQESIGNMFKMRGQSSAME